MNQTSGHLTDAQIRACVSSSMDPTGQQEVDAHIADCGSCLTRLLEAERIHLGLLEGRAMKRTPHPDCPAEETLQELAAGIHDPDTAETTIEHAAHCDYCGPLLTRYMKEFSEDLATEDTALLAQLKTSKPKWQKQFVRKNFPHPRPWFGFWPKMIAAGATATLAVSGYFVIPLLSDLHQAQALVATTFSAHRTTEIRLPSVGYGPIQQRPVERGSNSSDWTSEPDTLLKAQAILNNKRKTREELSPQWLEVEGKIDLLQSQPGGAKKATEAFQEALRKDSGNVNLRLDLAAGYFEEEVTTEPDHPDLEKTINLLKQVLKNPAADKQQQSIALFNLAVAYERSNMRDLAESAWEQYLQVDSISPWSSEARSRLQKLKERMPDPKQQGYVNSRDPAFFLANFSNPVVQHNLEEYQETALVSWLPKARQDSQSDSWQAAWKLAELLEKQHSDSWMADFLSATKTNNLQAVQTLAQAIAYNQQGLHEHSLSWSAVAAKAFAATGNTAGELRADFEEIYALRSLSRGQACLAYSLPLQRRFTRSNYPWLEAQFFLEQAECQNFAGNKPASEHDMEASLGLAQKSGLEVLELRIKGISVGIQAQQPEQCINAWRNSVDGMGDYWRQAYPPVRLGQFYEVLWECALNSDEPYAAEVLLRQALEIRRSRDIKKKIREGLMHLDLAEILKRQGDIAGAETEKNESIAVLAQVPGEDYANTYELTEGIKPAEHELQEENAELALLTLRRVEARLKDMQDNFYSLRFYRLLGNTYLRLGKLDEALAAYEVAIQMSEISLKGLGIDKDRLEWMRATGESYRGTVHALLKQGKDEEALVRWEWYRSRFLPHGPSDSEFELGPGSPSEELVHEAAFRRVLPHMPQVRIIYASFEDGLQIWLDREGRVSSHWVEIKRRELQHSAEEFIKQCATPSSDLPTLQKNGESLYRVLLQPVMSELPERGTLVIEPDYPISDLSLGALREVSGHYLAEGYAIAYSPGIWMESNLRSPRPIGAYDPLLLVDASHSARSGTLPGASLEINTISSLFPHTTIVETENKKWDEWRESLLNTEILVFLGHGRSDGNGTTLSLNSQESLGAKDFTPELLAHIRLVVLSACSTGVAGEDGPLDTDNLVYPFLSAGVSDVIASHWNVDSATTAKLMSSFYFDLQKERTVVQAIADAQRTMLRDMPHPYYWASFTLTGRSN